MPKARILLVHTEETRAKFNFLGIVEDEPVEIEMLYTVLIEAGHEAQIYDPDRYPENFETVLAEFRPSLVYANGVVKQIYYMREYVRRAKMFSPEIVTVLGGVFAEHNYQRLYMPELDYVCRSYDPNVLTAIVEHHAGQPVALASLNGLCRRQGENWVENEIVPYDIKLLPRMDRSHFYKYQSHFCLLKHRPLPIVRFAYSCSHNCTFCYRTMMNSGRYVRREVEDFVDEVASLACETVYILDDNFLVDRKVIRQFIDEVRLRKVKKKYICYGRCDFILRNKELIQELVDIGFIYFIVGFEALSDEHLKKYNKRTATDENTECIRFMQSIHAGLYAMMIVDLDFAAKDFRNLYAWAKRNNLEYVILSIFTPLPGTPVYEAYKDKLISSDWRKWDYTHALAKPGKLPLWRFYLSYYFLVARLFLLAKKHGSYDFLNFGQLFGKFIFGRLGSGNH